MNVRCVICGRDMDVCGFDKDEYFAVAVCNECIGKLKDVLKDVWLRFSQGE